MDQAHLTLRDADRHDAGAIATLLCELGYPAGEYQVAGRLERIGADPRARVIVAALDGTVAGLVATHVIQPIEHNQPWCELTALIVSSSSRRRGIGQALVGAAESEARARGCAGMVLGSGSWRPDAHAFYRHLGYEQTGARFKKQL